MTEMFHAIRDALGNYHYLFLYGLAILLLLFFLKGRRKIFVIFAILLSAAVLNPVFFKTWNRINDYAYWRTLWMLPVIPACAAVPAVLVEKEKKTGWKVCTVAAAAVVFVLAGTWIGSHDLTRFSKPYNVEKLPDGAVTVGKALLELDETPYVAADNDVCIYLRQYSANIHPMYGRDVYFGLSDATATETFHELTAGDGDLHRAAQLMLDNGYEYLVSKDADEQRQTALAEAGFEIVRELEGYRIYRVTGTPNVVCTYNELHQVTARTFVNEKGEPVNGPEGYATESYAYDQEGRIIRQFRTDTDGNGVPDASGKAGFERTYDRHWWITREVSLGTDGNPVNINGYAIRTCTFKGRKAESEYFYNADGSPASVGPGYAKCEYLYTDSGELSMVRYLDANDQPVEAGSAWFHEYLKSLKGRDISIFISARDEASNNMTATLWEDMKELGIQTDLRGQFRKSFYAVVTPEGTQEAVGNEPLTCSGMLDDIPYTVTSAGFNAGSYSSIMIGETEYSQNGRGLNIVVFDNAAKEVVETVTVDTFCQDMTITG